MQQPEMASRRPTAHSCGVFWGFFMFGCSKIPHDDDYDGWGVDRYGFRGERGYKNNRKMNSANFCLLPVTCFLLRCVLWLVVVLCFSICLVLLSSASYACNAC